MIDRGKKPLLNVCFDHPITLDHEISSLKIGVDLRTELPLVSSRFNEDGVRAATVGDIVIANVYECTGTLSLKKALDGIVEVGTSMASLGSITSNSETYVAAFLDTRATGQVGGCPVGMIFSWSKLSCVIYGDGSGHQLYGCPSGDCAVFPPAHNDAHLTCVENHVFGHIVPGVAAIYAAEGAFDAIAHDAVTIAGAKVARAAAELVKIGGYIVHVEDIVRFRQFVEEAEKECSCEATTE